MKMGWCLPGASEEQHKQCRLTATGAGVHAGQTHVCSCTCDARHRKAQELAGLTEVDLAIHELI